MDTRTQETTPAAGRSRKTSARWRKAIGTTVAVLVLGLLGWIVFGPDPLPVETASVVRGPMQVTVDGQGQVRAHDKYVVAAPVAGQVERVELHDGDPVRRDQVVATLSLAPMDPRQRQEATARLDAARALARESAQRIRRSQSDLELAINERERVQRLVKDKFVSPQAADKAIGAERAARAELDAARSREVAAQADIRAAEAALLAADTTGPGGHRQIELRSPVEGYVLKVHEKSIRTIPAGTPVMTVGDPRRYEIVVDVLSTDAVKVRSGQTMLLEGWGGGRTLQAKVRTVEPVAFTKISALGVEEQRVNIIADPIDDLGPLGDGYRVEARIVIWSGEDVVKAPGSSLFRVGDAWHLFVVEGGRAREREVKAGQRNQDEVQILSGVSPGATLVRYPGNQLRDGLRVAPANGQ